jgi:phosphoribosylamine--glycine ligase
LEWYEGTAVCVVMAAGGYPGSYEKGKVITGIPEAQRENALVFHAGTKLEKEKILTNGGRVLGVTCQGKDFSTAISATYSAVARINFDDMYYRRDIGHRIL